MPVHVPHYHSVFPTGGRRGEIKFPKNEALTFRLGLVGVQREIIWAASTRNETLMWIAASRCNEKRLKTEIKREREKKRKKKKRCTKRFKAARGRRPRRGADLSPLSGFFCTAREQRAARTHRLYESSHFSTDYTIVSRYNEITIQNI